MKLIDGNLPNSINTNRTANMSSVIAEMKPKFIQEKNRIFRLKCEAQETAKNKLFLVNLLGDTIIKTEKMIECENYYLALDKYLQIKINFWNGCIAGKISANLLPQIQESMTEWLETGWAYLGQKNIKKESEEAKIEFDFMKTMCERLKEKKSKKN